MCLFNKIEQGSIFLTALTLCIIRDNIDFAIYHLLTTVRQVWLLLWKIRLIKTFSYNFNLVIIDMTQNWMLYRDCSKVIMITNVNILRHLDRITKLHI